MNIKKGLPVCILISLALLVAHCGGNGEDSQSTRTGVGSQSTTSAQEKFNNPTGTLSNDNATELMNDALASNLASGSSAVEGLFRRNPRITTALQKVLPGTKFQFDDTEIPSELQKCISGDFTTSGTVDIGCLVNSGLLPGCTGGGKVELKTENEDSVIELDNVSLVCSSEGISVTDCEGTFRQNTTNSDLACANLTCTIDSVKETVDGCIQGNQVLVEDSGGESYVCLTVTSVDNCAKLCSDWSDSEGLGKIECDVSRKEAPCPPATGIREGANCTFTRGQSCQ